MAVTVDRVIQFIENNLGKELESNFKERLKTMLYDIETHFDICPKKRDSSVECRCHEVI